MPALDLRPLSLGEILDRTFSLYRRHFLLFVGISAIPHLLPLLFGLLQVWVVPATIAARRGPASAPVSLVGVLFGLALGLVFVLLMLIVYLWSQAATVFAVTDLYLGRETSISTSLRRVWDELLSLFGVVMLNGLATVAALLVFIIPGLYVACRLLVCVPAALVEGRGPRESLSRSWNLTEDYASRAFILYVLYFALSTGFSVLVQVPLALVLRSVAHDPFMLRAWTTVQQIFNVGLQSIVTPFMLIGTSLFYFDLRVRKEGFDLQFMMDPTSERLTPRAAGPVPSILS